ncbi:MAG: hypothetical protein V4556_07030 [Bacteroidota bacterium]
MKGLKLFSIILGISMFFFSCKKDFDYTDRLSHGTLQGANGECLPKNIHGTFKNGQTFTRDNYIDVHVNIDSVGSYEIATDTVNGYSFRGIGTLGVKGDNLVRLYGSGKPLSGGVNTFVIRYSGTFCTVSITVDGTVAPPAAPAAFTVTNTAGECSGATANGTYATGAILTAANTATIGVTVTTIGAYTISTPVVNGISFSKSGAFTTTGAQVITLTGSGTPIAPTTNNYTVTAGSSSCTFSVAVQSISSAAVFTLGGTPGVCTSAVPAGTFTVGTALTAANTLTVQVNVTAIGTYSISTNTVNGISFSKTGTFTAFGVQTVVLTGTGTPTAAGANSYTVTAGGNSCTFPITAVAGGGGGTSTNTASFNLDGVAKTFNVDGGAILDDSAGVYYLELGAFVSATSDESFYFYIDRPTVITAGTYSANSFASGDYVEGGYFDNALGEWYAFTDGTTQTGPLTVIITSITATRVQGTFQGIFRDNEGVGPGTKTITLGTFDFDIF